MNFNYLRGINLQPKKPVILNQNELVYTSGGTLIVLNLQNKNQKILPIHDKNITAFDCDFINNKIATGQEGTDDYKEKKAFIAIIDKSSMQMVKYLMDFNFGIEDLKFSNCGRFLAVHDWDFQFVIFETQNFNKLFYLKQERLFPQILWNEQSQLVQQCCLYMIESKKIKQIIYDNNKNSFKENLSIIQNKEFRDYNCPIFCCQFGFVITGTAQGEIVIFNQANITQAVFKKVAQSPIVDIKKASQNLFFCICQNNSLIKFQVDKNAQVNVLQNLSVQQQPLYLFTQQNQLFYLSKFGSISLINTECQQEQLVLQQPCNQIIDCCYDNNNQNLIQFLLDGQVVIYNKNGTIANQFKNKNFHNTSAQRLNLDQQNNLLTLAYQNGDIYFHELQNFTQKGFISSSHKGKVQKIYQNQKFLLTCCDQNLLRIWSSKNKQFIHEFNYHSKPITFCSAFGNESELIISASKDRQIIIYDLKRERKVKTFQIQNGYVQDILILNDDSFISVGHNTPVTLWTTNSNNPQKIIDEDQRCLKIQFSPQKTKFAVLNEQGEIKLYNANSLQKLAQQKVSYCKVQNLFWQNENEILFVEETGSFGVVEIN